MPFNWLQTRKKKKTLDVHTNNRELICNKQYYENKVKFKKKMYKQNHNVIYKCYLQASLNMVQQLCRFAISDRAVKALSVWSKQSHGLKDIVSKPKQFKKKSTIGHSQSRLPDIDIVYHRSESDRNKNSFDK